MRFHVGVVTDKTLKECCWCVDLEFEIVFRWPAIDTKLCYRLKVKAVEYLFEEYFTPDENWTESGEWYEETIDDEFVRTFMSFLRLPLHTISGLSALETEVANRLIDRVQELSVPNIDE